ncbi:CD225/dispanin family protein [Staphylococcus chromogenes]|nr:CD225/dispanin family protein [Staphylococcus chromogenes]
MNQPPPNPYIPYGATHGFPQSSGPGRPSYRPPMPPKPADYLWVHLLFLICCCSPLALPGSIVALMTKSRYRMGDYLDAKRVAPASKWLMILSIIGTIVFIAATLKVDDGQISWGVHWEKTFWEKQWTL